jgi:hypothetical protein
VSWQETLDRLFPDGASVTQLEDVPQDIEGSTQFLTPKLIVTDEEDDWADVTCNAFDFEKDISFTITKLEVVSPGVSLAITPGEEPDFLLSDNFEGPVRDALRTARKEWYS